METTIWTETETGYQSVALAEIVDYGGNVWGQAKTARGVRRVVRKIQLPTVVRVAKLGTIFASEISPYDTICI